MGHINMRPIRSRYKATGLWTLNFAPAGNLQQAAYRQRLAGDIYTNFLENKPPALPQDISRRTRRQMYYQHDETPTHSPRCGRWARLCI